jgi:5-aminopentanamidase
LKVTLVQKEYFLGDKGKNLALMGERIKASRSDLIVFPELFLTGYGIKDRLSLEAEALDGPSVKVLVALCRKQKKGVIFGMPRADPKVRGNIYNSAVMILPDGSVHCYDKWFLANFGPFEEKEFFTPGRCLPVIETPWGRFGLIICFDMFLPEITKAYALAGADCVVCISAAPTTSGPYFAKVIPARAIESTVFMIYCNVVGTDNNMVFWGGARVIGPNGQEIAVSEPLNRKDLVAEIDLSEVEAARRNRPTLRETRPELYEAMLSQVLVGYASRKTGHGKR